MPYARIYITLICLLFAIDNSMHTQLLTGLNYTPWSGEDRRLNQPGKGGQLGYVTKGEDGFFYTFTAGFAKYKGDLDTIPVPAIKYSRNGKDSIAYSNYSILGRIFPNGAGFSEASP
ncbi:MAG: hypothetical protein ACKVOK_03945 [Flavobacteriales bacterium]